LTSKLLKNDFAAAITSDIEDKGPGGGLISSEILKNKLGSGVSYHLKAPFPDGAHYFMIQNDYRGFSGGTTNLIPDPLALPFHFQP